MSISSTDAFWNTLSAYDTGSALATNEGARYQRGGGHLCRRPECHQQLDSRLGSGGGPSRHSSRDLASTGAPFFRQHPDFTGAERANPPAQASQ